MVISSAWGTGGRSSIVDPSKPIMDLFLSSEWSLKVKLRCNARFNQSINKSTIRSINRSISQSISQSASVQWIPGWRFIYPTNVPLLFLSVYLLYITVYCIYRICRHAAHICNAYWSAVFVNEKKKKKQITTGVVFYRPGQEHGEVIGVIGLDLRASYLEMLLKETFPACGNSSYV